jgi:hypothetical protein
MGEANTLKWLSMSGKFVFVCWDTDLGTVPFIIAQGL